MLVITTPEAAFKLDSSMLCVDGSYYEGYVYNKDIFFIEGIKDNEWCEIGQHVSLLVTHVVCKQTAEKINNLDSSLYLGSWETGYRLDHNAQALSSWHDWWYYAIGASCSLESESDEIPF